MAKFFELSEENTNLVDTVFQETGLHNYMEMRVFGVTKSKELIKIQKNNPVTEYLANVPDSISVQIYEDAFDRLDEENKLLLLRDKFGGVSYDTEKEKINIGTPQICVSVSGRRAYGDAIINAAEMGVMMIEQIEEEKKQLKEAKKDKKKS